MSQSNSNVDALNRNQIRVQVPVTSNLTVNQGDLVFWDGENFTVTPVTAASQVTTSNATTKGSGPFIGVALQSNNAPIEPGDPPQVGIMVLVRGTVWMYQTTGDVYGWFTPVTGTSDPQTITSTGAVATPGASFNQIGLTVPNQAVSPRALQATPAPERITGVAGQRVQVLIVPQLSFAAAV
jgi:hypothetical protein